MAEALKPISWDAVRALAAVVGVREAARRMQISEEQVKKRCTREGWLKTPEAREANKMAVALRSGSSAPVPVSPMSPDALIHAEITGLGRKTRLSLARGIAKVSEHVEQMKAPAILEDAQNVKAIAQTADLVHGWKDSTPNVKIRLDVLAAPSEAQVIDVEAEAISDSETTDCDLSDY